MKFLNKLILIALFVNPALMNGAENIEQPNETSCCYKSSNV